MIARIRLGFEVGTGAPVDIPIGHMAVTGQTQAAGKTTTLEALVSRSQMQAIAFITKRGEGGFVGAHEIEPYFRDRADWQFVSSVLEATLRERLKFERSWIMRACKGAMTLKDVQRNVQTAMIKAKGLAADVYLTLDHYLDIVVPQIERLRFRNGIDLSLRPGLNVMNLVDFSMELQALIIRSVLEWVYTKSTATLVIIPEAWEFIPQKRGSPVLLACEALIRKGGALRNFIWLDSQDIAGVHKDVLRSVGVWIIGVQREANEVKRALAHIPGNVKKPSVDDIMGLERGQFFVCYGKVVVKVYVQPSWVDEEYAIKVATGHIDSSFVDKVKPKREDDDMDEDERRLRQGLVEENRRLTARVKELEASIAEFTRVPPRDVFEKPAKELAAAVGTPPTTDYDGAYAEFRKRILNDTAVLSLLREKKELVVHAERKVIEANDSTLFGRLACLIVDGFFEEIKAGNAAHIELQRRGWGSAKPNVYRECDKLTTHGFLTKEDGGYRAAPDANVRIVVQATNN